MCSFTSLWGEGGSRRGPGRQQGCSAYFAGLGLLFGGRGGAWLQSAVPATLLGASEGEDVGLHVCSDSIACLPVVLSPRESSACGSSSDLQSLLKGATLSPEQKESSSCLTATSPEAAMSYGIF